MWGTLIDALSQDAKGAHLRAPSPRPRGDCLGSNARPLAVRRLHRTSSERQHGVRSLGADVHTCPADFDVPRGLASRESREALWGCDSDRRTRSEHLTRAHDVTAALYQLGEVVSGKLHIVQGHSTKVVTEQEANDLV